jgi:hypothetical protein
MSDPVSAPERRKAARLLSPQPLEVEEEEEEDNDDNAVAASGPTTGAEHKEEDEQSGDEDDDEQSPSPVAISRAVLAVPRRATALLPVAVPVDPSDVPNALPVVGSAELYLDDDTEISPSPPVAAPADSNRQRSVRRRRRLRRLLIAAVLLLALVVGLSVGLTSNNNKPPGDGTAAKPPPPSASSTLPPDPDHFAYNDPPNCTDLRAALNTCAGITAANASNANTTSLITSGSSSGSSGEPAGPCETCVVQYFGGVVGLTLNLSDALGAFRCEQIDDETCAALDACKPGPCSGTCAKAFLARLACESACPSDAFPCWQSA